MLHAAWQQDILSDAFAKQNDAPAIDLAVKVININYGKKSKILDASKSLNYYSYYTYRTETNRQNGMSNNEAVRESTTYCINHNIMRDYLIRHKEEVFDMYAPQWNEEDAKRAWKEDTLEDAAISMLKDGVEPKFVAKWTRLPLERVQEIKASLKN